MSIIPDNDQFRNGWKTFNLDDCSLSEMLRPHWLLNSRTRDIALARRMPGARGIHMLDRNDQRVIESDGFDWVKAIDMKPGPLPGEKVWKNPLPVVVMLVPTIKGLLLVRRAARDTHGRIALPGGFQEVGETWQEAGCRETFEETGVALSPSKVRIFDVDTVEDGKVNLIYGVYDGIHEGESFTPQEGEILEVLTTTAPIKTAFDSHTRMISRYFA